MRLPRGLPPVNRTIASTRESRRRRTIYQTGEIPEARFARRHRPIPSNRLVIRPRRSVLFMPGSNARAMEKARTLPADGIVLDLEDGVAPDAKAAARNQVVEAVRQGYGRREVIVRVNGLGTPWGRDDLIAIATAD